MDKKKKHGATGSSEGKDHSTSQKNSASKPRPTHIAPTGSGNNGNKFKASTNSSSDRDNTPIGTSKTHAHAPDDAVKPGPQKKRRKVTHGTALNLPSSTMPYLSP